MHIPTFKSLKSSVPIASGILLRILWLFTSFLLVASFSGMFRANVIKLRPVQLLEKNEEVMTAGEPIMLWTNDELAWDSLEKSPLKLDRWLYENVKDVYFYDR